MEETVKQQQQIIADLKKQLEVRDNDNAELMLENIKMKQELNDLRDNQQTNRFNILSNKRIATRNQTETVENTDSETSHKILQQKGVQLGYFDSNLKELPKDTELKFWTTENGEKLLIIQNRFGSDILEELESSASSLVKWFLWIFFIIHWLTFYPMLFCNKNCIPNGLQSMFSWFASMITAGTHIIIVFIVLIDLSVVDVIIGVICIVIGLILISMGIYTIICHRKWFHQNKDKILPSRTIKIDYSKNEIIRQHTEIIYGFFSRYAQTKQTAVIPISYNKQFFFEIKTDEYEDGSGLRTYYHTLYADSKSVCKLDKTGTSKQACQLYGNTLIQMINDQ